MQDNDGAYIIGINKYLTKEGPLCIVLIKTDSKGNTIWKKEIATSKTTYKAHYSSYNCLETADNAYLLVVNWGLWGALGSLNTYLIKLDSRGNTIWESKGDNFYADYSCVTSDDGFIVCGSSATFIVDENKSILLKFDGNGKIIWKKSFSLDSFTFFQAIKQNSDHGFCICATTSSNNVYLIKTDKNGNVLGY